jgi:hypothetical protein
MLQSDIALHVTRYYFTNDDTFASDMILYGAILEIEEIAFASQHAAYADKTA